MRYAKLLPATQRIGHIQLPQALVALGMTSVGCKKTKYGQGRLMVSKLNEWQLFDLYVAARKLYRLLVVQLHPDRGGSACVCARLNALWARIEFLFKRKGIEV
jgi:hypothetical protein